MSVTPSSCLAAQRARPASSGALLLHASSLSDSSSSAAKIPGAGHILPLSWPIARYWHCEIVKKLSSPSYFFASTPQVRQAASALLLALAGCAAPQPEHYAAELPLLDVQQYFNGRLEAHGMFQDRSGKVIKRFTVLMRCRWEGHVGTLDEAFTYADGTRQQRVWTLRKTAPGRLVGTAPDVVGEAVGVVAGNTLHWTYVLALPVNGTVYHVDFDDWMFLIDQRVMLNRAAMSKFGVGLGAVTLSFDKRMDGAP